MLLDYYVVATDKKGNVKKVPLLLVVIVGVVGVVVVGYSFLISFQTDIYHVWVGNATL